MNEKKIGIAFCKDKIREHYPMATIFCRNF